MPKSHTQTGRVLGKKAQKQQNKNNEAVEEFLTLVKAAPDAESLGLSLASNRKGPLELAKVDAPLGGGHIKVTKSDSVTETVRIAGAITLHGKAGNKTERDNCLYAGSHVILRGGDAAGRIPRAKVTEIKNVYEKLAIPTMKNFFLVDVADKDEEDCGVDFVEDEEEDITEEDIDAM